MRTVLSRRSRAESSRPAGYKRCATLQGGRGINHLMTCECRTSVTHLRNVLRHPHGRTRCTRARGRVVTGVHARLRVWRCAAPCLTRRDADAATRCAPLKLRSCAARARSNWIGDDVSSQHCTVRRGSTHLRHYTDVVRATHFSRRRPSTIIPTAPCISLVSRTHSPHLRGARIW